MKKNLFALFVLLIFSACSTGPISTYVPMNRMDSPETSGRALGGSLQGGMRSNTKVTLTNDYGINSINRYNPVVESAASHGLDGDLGVLDRLDLSLKVLGDPVWRAQAKFQFLGSPRTEAKSGNFSMAAVADYGSSTYEETHVSSGWFGFPSGTQAKYLIKNTLYELGLILGYRAMDPLVIYTGFTYSKLQYKGDQTMYSQALVQYSDSVQQNLYHLGLIYSPMGVPGVFFQTEGDVAMVTAKNNKSTKIGAALSIGVQW